MNAYVLSRYWPALAALIGLRLMFWLGAFPNPDEAYYWVWGQHPAWSYFDHPPWHAWVQGGFDSLLGRSLWVLRLPNLLSNLLLVGLYGLICRQLYDRQTRNAFWLTVLLLFTSPLFFLFLAMAWHDHWLIVFGTAASYCLVKCLSGDRPTAYPWLYGAGLCIGLAGLAKYLALLMGVGFLVAIASRPSWRSWFANPHLYGAMLLALAITAPVFWWNAQHEWYSLQFYLGRSVQSEAATTNWWGPLGFLLLNGLIFGPVHVWLTIQTSSRGFTTRFGTAYQQVAICVFATSTLLLALLSFRAPVLYYWNILAYPLLLPLMAGHFLSLHRLFEVRHRRLLQVTAAIGIAAAGLLTVHFTVLPLSAMAGATGDDDTRMLYGWPTVAAVVKRETAPLAERSRLLTTDYRSAAALAYVLNDRSVLAISGRIDQFDFWYDAAALAGREAILLGDRWHPICPSHLAMFERTDPPTTIPVERWGVPIKEYTLIRGYGFQPLAESPLAADYPLAFTSDGETCSPDETSP
ncbi:MAG: ArnT family glycosyltransferase [Leptolyngbyaceae cyanobacterium]